MLDPEANVNSILELQDCSDKTPYFTTEEQVRRRYLQILTLNLTLSHLFFPNF